MGRCGICYAIAAAYLYLPTMAQISIISIIILMAGVILWLAVLFAILRLFSIDTTLKKILRVLQKQAAGAAANLLDDEELDIN
jgi:hypothetical protein